MVRGGIRQYCRPHRVETGIAPNLPGSCDRWHTDTVSRGGLSRAGLAQLRDVMASHVERGSLPGLVALVARHGDVHVEMIGTKALGDAEPVERDSIFRIASLSKPVAAVATMVLVEDGPLSLDGSVEDLLPELANRRVSSRHFIPSSTTRLAPSVRSRSKTCSHFDSASGRSWCRRGHTRSSERKRNCNSRRSAPPSRRHRTRPICGYGISEHSR